jgi:hypothetical protein
VPGEGGGSCAGVRHSAVKAFGAGDVAPGGVRPAPRQPL